MTDKWLVLLESNTTGTGRMFCAEARAIGLRPVVLSREPSRYPYLGTDGIDTIVTDTNNQDAVIAACARLPGLVVGVTSSSEYYIAAAAVTARSAGLPHPDPEAVMSTRDKGVLRARLRAAGLPSPSFGVAATLDDAVDIARRIGFPVVVKPVSGSGSVGVRLCSDSAAVKDAVANVLDTAPAGVHTPSTNGVLVENYLEGPEYSVETFDDLVIGVTAKHLGPEPHFVETGHDFPAPLSTRDRTALGDAALAALRAMGLCWGAAHVELRLTPSGPCVVEINPRLAGGMIPRVVREATGVDLIAAVVAKAAGLRPQLQVNGTRHAAIRFLLAEHSGRLERVHGIEQAARAPGVVAAAVVRDAGQVITVEYSFRDRLAYLITATDDASAATIAETELRTMKAEISPV